MKYYRRRTLQEIPMNSIFTEQIRITVQDQWVQTFIKNVRIPMNDPGKVDLLLYLTIHLLIDLDIFFDKELMVTYTFFCDGQQ